MKILNRVLAAVICCVCFVLQLPCTAFAITGDEIRAAKKIISVVYDDSSSMFGDDWVYTNYAMQTLTAQLNEQDELYITYMSVPTQAQKIDLADVGAAVAHIRKWTQYGGTPGESIDTAKARLDGISEDDPSTQFWLVVLTDGQITMNTTIQDKMDHYKGEIMSNGSSLNIVYLGMGTDALTVTADESGGLYSYHSQTSDEIFTAMSEIANLISGRIEATQVQQVDDDTITFRSTLPLYSISVLSQQTNASVTKAETQEETLHINRNIALDASDPFVFYSTAKLFGNAAVINREDASGNGQVIPAGTYTITFSDKVELNDLVVQYEPAIGLKYEITHDGIVVDDLSGLAMGDRVNIAIIPVVPGTDDVISKEDLPDDISWSIEYEVDGNMEESGNGTTLNDVTLKSGEGIIRGTMTIPGYAPSVFEVYADIAEFVYALGIEVEQPEPLSYLRNRLSGSEQGSNVKFWLTNEGKRLSAEEQKEMDVTLLVDEVVCDNSNITGFFHRLGSIKVKCELRHNDDGSFTLQPKAQLAFISFLLMAGDYTVQVVASKDTAVTENGTFTVVPKLSDWLNLLILLAILIVLSYLIFIIFIKYKFKGQIIHYEAYRLMSDGTGSLNRAVASSEDLPFYTGHLLLPVRASFVKYRDLKLVAGPDGIVYITGESIAQAVYGYGTSRQDPVDDLEGIVSMMHITEKKEGNREAADQTLSKTPIYFRSTQKDRTIWRIWIDE